MGAPTSENEFSVNIDTIDHDFANNHAMAFVGKPYTQRDYSITQGLQNNVKFLTNAVDNARRTNMIAHFNTGQAFKYQFGAC